MVDYSPWSPIEADNFSLEVKTNRARSIQASAPEPVVPQKTSSLRQRNNKIRVNDDGTKGLRRRNFEAVKKASNKNLKKKFPLQGQLSRGERQQYLL